MLKAMLKRLAIAEALALAIAPRAAPAQFFLFEPPRFDGVWIIDASVASPFCPRHSRRLFLAIINGRVAKVAGVSDPPPKASGAIDQGGGVDVAMSALGYTAQIRGTLRQGVGSGNWTANSSLCAGGSWTAFKAN